MSDGQHTATCVGDKTVAMQKAPWNFPVYNLCAVSWM